jgi:hypothetical protein
MLDGFELLTPRFVVCYPEPATSQLHRDTIGFLGTLLSRASAQAVMLALFAKCLKLGAHDRIGMRNVCSGGQAFRRSGRRLVSWAVSWAQILEGQLNTWEDGRSGRI